MRKIHVITQKEAVSEEKVEGCTAVVIDVFLATSTIGFLLEYNYEPVFAVKDSSSALALASRLEEPYILLGETKGEAIKGFRYPDPSLLLHTSRKEAAVICSTNGTRAIEKARKAKILFISSLVNGHLIAERLHDQEDDSSIVLICSGNDDRFSLEDFVGAGQIVEHLMKKGEYVLSDSSIAARDAYQNSKAGSFSNLLNCETAKLLRSFGYANSIDLVIRNHEKLEVIPILSEGKILNGYAKIGGRNE